MTLEQMVARKAEVEKSLRFAEIAVQRLQGALMEVNEWIRREEKEAENGAEGQQPTAPLTGEVDGSPDA